MRDIKMFPDYLTQNDVKFLDLCFDVFVKKILFNKLHNKAKIFPNCEELKKECYQKWESRNKIFYQSKAMEDNHGKTNH